MYANLPYIAKVLQQDPGGVFPGDILWSKGHVVLVLEVEKNSNSVPLSFTILESSGDTRIKKLSLSAFKERWDKVGWIVYRDLKLADNLNYEPIPFVRNPGDPLIDYSFNPDLCTNRGDMAVYRQGEDVTINIFGSGYSFIDVSKDDIPLCRTPIVSGKNDYVFSQLQAGLYSVRLFGEGLASSPILFEVVGECTNVTPCVSGYCISFSSVNAKPEYIVICSRDGNRDAVIDIADSDRLAGYKVLDGSYYSKYLKVFYKGKYGRVSNNPIQL